MIAETVLNNARIVLPDELVPTKSSRARWCCAMA